jgi:hypothetical protein
LSYDSVPHDSVSLLGRPATSKRLASLFIIGRRPGRGSALDLDVVVLIDDDPDLLPSTADGEGDLA